MSTETKEKKPRRKLPTTAGDIMVYVNKLSIEDKMAVYTQLGRDLRDHANKAKEQAESLQGLFINKMAEA